MDYLKSNRAYQIRKFIRYVGLYGLKRTIIKVRSYYHFKSISTTATFKEPQGNVAIIGCGKYSYAVIGYYLKKNRGNVIRSVYDVNYARAVSMAKKYNAVAVRDVQDIFDDEGIELVYIASNHYTHAEYAMEALERDKIVHIEKPHVVNWEQHNRLTELVRLKDSRINLGYNRPKSNLSKILLDRLSDYQGQISASWFVSGHEIERDHWYFDEKEGGRVLGNLCHWIDFSYQILLLNGVHKIDIHPVTNGKDKENVGIVFVSNKGDVLTINFSAKGHTFEGVGEVLCVHRGDMVAYLTDYKRLEISDGYRKRIIKNRYRQHGHESNVCDSYDIVGGAKSVDNNYVEQSGRIMLLVKDAIDSNLSKEFVIKNNVE